ncbi:MAG TPA: CDP-alcohol phosphatidyltransferase family protein [Methylocella sp.]|nr:CDP-alcohol phosphatidyltransferase family protein [Methylocella sp.]
MALPLPGLLIHGLTASGAALGLAALFAAAEEHFPIMFAWLGAALFVDAVDGSLARRYKIDESALPIDGVILDLVVDFLTYVVVPLVAFWRSGLLPAPLSVFLCCIVGAASALYFADRRMKTHDLWFRGFPAIWNVLIFYLLVLRPGPLVAAATMIIAAALMFVPVVFVHPLRVLRWRSVTLTATGAWTAAAVAAVDQGLSEADFSIKTVLVGVGFYFLILPLFRKFS